MATIQELEAQIARARAEENRLQAEVNKFAADRERLFADRAALGLELREQRQIIQDPNATEEQKIAALDRATAIENEARAIGREISNSSRDEQAFIDNQINPAVRQRQDLERQLTLARQQAATQARAGTPPDVNFNTDPDLPQVNPSDVGAAETFEPRPVDPNTDPVERARVDALIDEMSPVISKDEEAESNAQTKALLKQAQEQASIQQFFNQATKGDWRVRLRIAPDADYLYQDKSNSLLAPLRVSDGVVFPYTPIINTSYAAKYDPYDLTHSNYRGYFYKGSQVSDVQIQATFTAQDTREAEYVLAVIQFFRSATKMFYGKDQQRGSPPPLVYLRGYGEYQFNDHACVITNFQYNLPNDVDYIAVTPNNIGLNMSNRLNQVGSSPVSTISSAIGRLSNLFNAVTGQPGVPKGAGPGDRGDLGLTRQTVSGTGQTTYVPTKIDMNITLLPIQTRSQVSKQFSVKEFANGNLLKGGFW